MSKFKTTLIICFLSIFSISYAIAMDDEEKTTNIKIHKVAPQGPQSSHTSEETKCCWGLSRWFCGIKEYLLCENDEDPERAYILRREVSSEQYEIIRSSDCYFRFHDYGGSCNPFNPDDGPFSCCITYCCLALCCPFTPITHVLCLPYQCCHCTPNQSITTITPTPQSVARSNGAARKQAEAGRVMNMTPEERAAEQERLETIRTQEAQANIDRINNQTAQTINTTNYGIYNYWNNVAPPTTY